MARRGCLISGIVIGALVVGGVVFADHQFRGMAESAVADALIGHGFADADQPVTVQVGGGPVLVQVARGRLSDVQIDAHSTQLNADTTVHADLTQVSIRPPYDSDQVTMTLTVPTAELPEVMNGHASLAGMTCSTSEQHLQCGEELEVASHKVPVTADLDVSVANSELVLTPTAFHVGGITATAAMVSAAGGPAVLTNGVHLPSQAFIPTSLQLTGASVSDGAVTFTVTGTNVPLGDLG